MSKQLRNTFKASDELYNVYDGEAFKIAGKSKAGYDLIKFDDGYQIEAEENEIYSNQ